MHCAILLGFVEDILVDAVMGHPALDLPTKTAVARAANKVLLAPVLILAKCVGADLGAMCN